MVMSSVWLPSLEAKEFMVFRSLNSSSELFLLAMLGVLKSFSRKPINF